MTTPSLDVRKQRLRRTMQPICGSISAECALSAGEAISNRVAEWSRWRTSSQVALFATLEGEVDSGPLIERVLREGKQLLLPRMVSGRSLEFAVVVDPESLRPGRYGVLEPDAQCPQRPMGGDGLVFVPGIAFDRAGGRLGRGAGYYDRALAECVANRGRPRFVGLGFADQVVETVPVGSLDVRMDAIVTESEFFLTD